MVSLLSKLADNHPGGLHKIYSAGFMVSFLSKLADNHPEGLHRIHKRQT